MADATGAAMRYEYPAFLNIGTAVSPDYVLMGTGFSKLDDKLSPKIDEVVYINDVSATKTLTGYSNEWSFDATVIKDDDVVTFLRDIGKAQSTGADAETDVVMFDMWDVSAGTGLVDAKRYPVTVSMESIGSGSGGEKLTMSGSLLGSGDPVDGVFDTADDTFDADVS
jgi:hypothetical protein